MTDLIPFSLEKLKDGYGCVTECGKKAIFIGNLDDLLADKTFNYPLVFAIEGEGWVIHFDKYGKDCQIRNYDGVSKLYRLMLKPKTKKLWVGIGNIKFHNSYVTTRAYESKNDAINDAYHFLDKCIIKEIEVEL